MGQENIYQAPEAQLVEGPKDNTAVIKIAELQIAMVRCFLGYMFFAVTISFLQDALPQAAIIAQTLAVICMIMLVYFTAKLCWNVYGKVAAVAMIFLCLVPLINLLIVIAASSRATSRIKSKGFKVGLTGANISKMKAAA